MAIWVPDARPNAGHLHTCMPFTLPLSLSPSHTLSLSLSQSLSFCHDLRCKALGFGSKSLAAEESRAFRRPKSRSRGTLGCCLAFSSPRGSQGGVWGGGLGMGSLPLLFCKAGALGFQTPIQDSLPRKSEVTAREGRCFWGWARPQVGVLPGSHLNRAVLESRQRPRLFSSGQVALVEGWEHLLLVSFRLTGMLPANTRT